MRARVNHILTTLAKTSPYEAPDRMREWRNFGDLQTMELAKIDTFAKIRPADTSGADMLVANCLAAAAEGDHTACFDLGVAYSTGSHGVSCDLVEAHKWFNLAAVGGHEEAAWCRADISDEMTAREIAEAQRRAREWLRSDARRAA